MTRRSIGFNVINAPEGSSRSNAETTYLISESLHYPVDAIAYHVGQRLREIYPDKALLETEDCQFSIELYAQANGCKLSQKPHNHAQRVTEWRGPSDGLEDHVVQTWYEVQWQAHRLEVLTMHWNYDYHHFILANASEIAESFLIDVCRWNAEPRAEVLVFQDGCWEKDDVLLRAIKNASFDSLVLRGTLKDAVREDATTFFGARKRYEGFGVPWKRGILFMGPPGNGKTHAVKALVNESRQRCLYVKSFRSQRETDECNILGVFGEARKLAPCVLVLEDLDSLITRRNRSFFLNELDGFAVNNGILTLATTNYPERLDPSIINRPSRFDRKYCFDLPALEERQSYISRWNSALQPDLRLSWQGLQHAAEQTEGFSFAYLKELFLSTAMAWVEMAEPGVMDTVIGEQVHLLREQMVSATARPEGEDPDDEDEA